MSSHLLIRAATVAALLASTAAGIAATASPAYALRVCGSGSEEMYYNVSSSPPTTLTVEDIIYFPSNPSCDSNFAISISKYIGNNQWQVVATGAGYLQYSCTGGRYLYTTSVTAKEGGAPFYCG